MCRGTRLRQPGAAVAWIVPWRGSRGVKRAVLFACDDDLLVSGRRPLPMVQLQRGDEIRIRGASVFYTDEDPLQVMPFDPSQYEGQAPACARCHRPLQNGEPVIVCPVCGLPYMVQPDKNPNCWTFGQCVGCGRDPKRQFVWQPEETKPRRRRRQRAPIWQERLRPPKLKSFHV